jgi:hypothetical protein
MPRSISHAVKTAEAVSHSFSLREKEWREAPDEGEQPVTLTITPTRRFAPRLPPGEGQFFDNCVTMSLIDISTEEL